MIIDFHTHCYPDNIAPKAVKKLSSDLGLSAYSDGTLSGTIDEMNRIGIDISVVLPVVTKVGQFENINLWAKKISEENSSIISFGSVHHLEPKWKEQINSVKQMGLPGIKLHPDFQEFYFGEQHIVDMVKYAIDIGLLVTVHVGVDPACAELVHSTPQMVQELVKKVDSERLILAHLGGYLYWDEVLEYVCGTNCTLDTALAPGSVNPKKLVRIFSSHGYDRLLFGTDKPWGSAQTQVRNMNDLLISHENYNKIMYQNAARLLKIDVE